MSYRVMTIFDDFNYYFFVFLDQNPSTFVLPRMSSSPMKNITFPAHLQRQRRLALMTWMIVILHGYKFSMENELAWVSIMELFSTFKIREYVFYSIVSDLLLSHFSWSMGECLHGLNHSCKCEAF
jgi:hypothetical protein